MKFRSLKQMILIFVLGFSCAVPCAICRAASSKAPSNKTPPPLVVRMAPPATVNVELPKSSPQPQPLWTYWLPPILSGLLGFLGVTVALWFGQRSTFRTIQGSLQANQATNWQKANDSELGMIEERLEKFYGPMMTRLQADHLLAQQIRKRQPVPEDYRLLRNLFNTEWRDGLSEGDRTTIEQICVEHSLKLEKMIMETGSVDPVLIPYFSRVVAHFRILRLAYQEKLGSDFEPFKDYVYPKALDWVLRLEIRRLRGRVAEIRRNPTDQLSPMQPLTIPDDERYKLAEWPDSDGRILQNERWLD